MTHEPSQEPDDLNDQDDAVAQDATPAYVTRLRQVMPYIMVLVLGLIVGALLFSSSKGPVPASSDEAMEPGQAVAQSVWTCSMHPQIQAPEPGQCPICGMDLIPASSQGTTVLNDDQVHLTARAQKLARIQTSPVIPTVFEGTDRTMLGQVSSDESSLKAITAWIGGRIDKLYISTTGERVKRGQAMARLYSPQVYAAHQDLLVALRQVSKLEQAGEYARDSARAQVESARQRLRLLGFTRADVTSMEKADKPWTQVTIRSTTSGTVMTRRVRSGEYVTQGAVLFEVADLESVWVELDAYESDLKLLTEGQAVELSFDALDEEAIMGTVSFIDPVVDPRTRVAKVRVEVPNKARRLKPGMYARATLEPGIAQAGAALSLVIPRSAPLYAGERALVYVEKDSDAEGTTYEARDVILGPTAQGQVVVRAGLERGERVVTHGAFVLDSDLQIRGKLSLMARPDDTQRAHIEPPLTLTPEQRAQLSPVITGYLDVQELLVDDRLADSVARAVRWRTQIEGIALKGQPARVWSRFDRLFIADIEPLGRADSLEQARAQFSLLTQTLDRFLQKFGNVSDESLRRAYCPMAQENQGDFWYQRGSTVSNVYFGEQMRTCGELREVLAPGSYLMTDASPLAPTPTPQSGGPHVH